MRKILAPVCIFVCFVIAFTVFFSHKTENGSEVSADAPLSSSGLPVVIIDAGHGGFDGGASTSDGVPEKDINLAVSIYLKEYLEFLGFKTLMTREDDVSLEDEGLDTIKKRKTSDIHNRFKLMEETEDSIFVSIHQNKYSVEKYHGAQVFYSPNCSEASSKLAQCIQNAIVQNIQNDNTRLIKKCDTSVYLIFNAVRPAVLVECGFLSNNSDAANLKTPEYQQKTAFCIAQGILDSCTQ